MLTPCENCGHEIWSEVRASGAFGLLVHFDFDERSGTYAEHTPWCPGCGDRLDRGLPEAEARAYSPVFR